MPVDPRSASPKTVFIHIMKTGGMTFRSILKSIYGAGFHLVDDPTPDTVAAALASHDCLEFHTMTYRGDYIHMHAELVLRQRWDVLAGTNIFTMLREPVDQVVSQYFYMVRQRALIEPAYTANGIRFPESLEDYLDNPAHFNNQLAFLMGNYRLKPGNNVDHADLAAVKAMFLSLAVHPGLTERFAESMHVFEGITGRRLPGGQIRSQNTNPTRPPLESIPASTRDRIRELSALDIELYEFARDLFEQDLAHCGPAPQYHFVNASGSPAVA